MTVGPEYDAVVAGGGLSGLTLAAHLAAYGWRDRRVLVVDDHRATPATAACWAYWSDRPGLLDRAVSRSYRQVRVNAAATSRVVPLGRYRYRLVRRADLSRVVAEMTADCPYFEHRRGVVEAVRSRGDVAEVVVDGRTLRCRWAFDSVGSPRPGTGSARIAFTGWEIRTARPVFDPDTPTLFDFAPHPTGAASFVYVLPDDPRRALVEVTAFVPRGGRPPTGRERSAALTAYLDDVGRAGGYDVLRTEAAVLPLLPYPGPRASGRVLRIGGSGGLVKAGTGYAYERIQRDSAAIARSLARYGDPFHLPAPPRRHRMLDAVLLDVVAREPAELERAFGRLFAADPAERVLRFLDEDTALWEELRLVAALPPRPFVTAAARLARRRR